MRTAVTAQAAVVGVPVDAAAMAETLQSWQKR
jgi:hypothetical protein